jgi:hypothetical protein
LELAEPGRDVGRDAGRDAGREDGREEGRDVATGGGGLTFFFVPFSSSLSLMSSRPDGSLMVDVDVRNGSSFFFPAGASPAGSPTTSSVTDSPLTSNAAVAAAVGFSAGTSSGTSTAVSSAEAAPRDRALPGRELCAEGTSEGGTEGAGGERAASAADAAAAAFMRSSASSTPFATEGFFLAVVVAPPAACFFPIAACCELCRASRAFSPAKVLRNWSTALSELASVLASPSALSASSY